MDRVSEFRVIVLVLLVLVVVALPACGGGGGDASAECIEALEVGEGWEMSIMDLVRNEPVSDWSDGDLLDAALRFNFADVEAVVACEDFMNKVDQEGRSR